jgi:hypothetical protein
LARSQFRTCHSPNQRTTQGWEGKKPASAGFSLELLQLKISKR